MNATRETLEARTYDIARIAWANAGGRYLKAAPLFRFEAEANFTGQDCGEALKYGNALLRQWLDTGVTQPPKYEG